MLQTGKVIRRTIRACLRSARVAGRLEGPNRQSVKCVGMMPAVFHAQGRKMKGD
jgi:hypothetical protein